MWAPAKAACRFALALEANLDVAAASAAAAAAPSSLSSFVPPFTPAALISSAASREGDSLPLSRVSGPTAWSSLRRVAPVKAEFVTSSPKTCWQMCTLLMQGCQFVTNKPDCCEIIYSAYHAQNSHLLWVCFAAYYLIIFSPQCRECGGSRWWWKPYYPVPFSSPRLING